MSPKIKFNLELEPISYMWNGDEKLINPKYHLIPDHQVKHLHRRVYAWQRRGPRAVSYVGRVVGKLNCNGGFEWLVEEEVSRKVLRAVTIEVLP